MNIEQANKEVNIRMRIRPAISSMSLDEAMKNCHEVSSKKELIECLNKHFLGELIDMYTLVTKHYGLDPRNGWDTYLLTGMEDFIEDTENYILTPRSLEAKEISDSFILRALQNIDAHLNPIVIAFMDGDFMELPDE